ncbi:N-acetylmuramoyl-L-alanine amidase [Yeosuana marina]|uniref:N-acetylmuramoyl-L-alanine amidase family protein n=1 Tax=Yeosuana marina TaxID=1565536 RepID=UPI0030C84F49
MILLLKIYFVFGQQKVIVIDPGHGGKDSGAIGVNSIQEKDVELGIAKEILRLNKTLLNNEFDIFLTRYKDTLISLSDRTKLAKILNADLFISLHCNHSDNPKARGIEVYVSKNEYRNSKESVWFAYQLQNQIKKQLGFQSRGVKFADFQVLRETVDCCSSLLLELGFLSNWDENRYYNNSSGIRTVAFVLMRRLIKIREL